MVGPGGGTLSRLDVRGRLFLVSLGLMVVLGGVLGLLLERQIRARIEADLQAELQTQARLFARMVYSEAPGAGSWDGLADAAGEAGGARFSVIVADGRVVGDSQVAEAALPEMDDHSRRPEVQQARAAGLGVAQRFSRTLGMDMVYVAVPLEGGEAVVRAAMPMSELRDAVVRLRVLMAGVGVVGLVVAGGMSGLASYWATRDLRELLQQAQKLAQGEGRRLSLTSPRGELSGLVGSFNQLSEELEGALASLAVERDRFGAVLEGMGEAVIAIDVERRITLLNRAAYGLFRPSRPPLGQPLVLLIRASAVHDAIRQALAGTPAAAEFLLNAEAPRSILVTATPQQRGRGCVLVCRDVTELRRLERMRRDFIANVGHELRTPVTIIRANAETLMDGALQDPQHAPTFVAGIHRNAERLSRLIEGLLNLSHLETGNTRLELESTSLAGVAEQAWLGLRTKAEGRGQDIRLRIPPDLTVTADAQALEQVLTNLIDNAIKYCPEGARITLRAEPAPEEGGRVRLEVIDDGPGISEHHQARVFERFYRVDAGRSKKMGGTGLGLAIVKHLVEAMHGRVGVTSEPPEGTTFWVELPPGEPPELGAGGR